MCRSSAPCPAEFWREGLVAKLPPGTPVGPDARITRQGESIAQRSRRSQREIGVGGGSFCLGHHWPGCENHAPRGKHRTEVTEVTEGRSGLVVEASAWDTRWPGCENHALRGKHRTEVTEGDRGWWWKLLPGTPTRQGEGIAQRSRRSQRETGLVVEASAWDTVGLGARMGR
jgi:hypothetical protein